MNNRSRNDKVFHLLKSFLFIFSLILLLFALIQLIIPSNEQSFLGRETNIESIIISITITTILLVSSLVLITLKEYRSYFEKKRYIQEGNSYLTLTAFFTIFNTINYRT